MNDYVLSRQLEVQAKLLMAEGEAEQAEEKFRRALDLARQENDPYRMAGLLQRLGECLMVQKMYSRAGTCLKTAIDYSNRFDDRRTANLIQAVLLEKLASCLVELRCFDHAMQALRKSLLITTSIYGLNSNERVSRLLQLAACVEAKGDYPSGLIYRQDVEKIIVRMKLFVNTPKFRAHTLARLADCLSALSRYREAEARYREALQLAMETLAQDDLLTLMLMELLANNLSNQRRFAEAEPLYFHIATIHWKRVDEWDETSFHSYWRLASCLSAQGKYAEAEPLYRTLIEVNAYLYSRNDLVVTPESDQLLHEHQEVLDALSAQAG